MSIFANIQALTKQLYPTGRAFKMPVGGYFEKLSDGLTSSEARAYVDSLSILSSLLPDNDNFTEEDASIWEQRLGLISNLELDLSVRKMAIQRKMNHPSDIKARQNWRYLERELQAAGFDLYVFENRFDDGFGGLETRSAIEVSGLGGDAFLHGDGQLGDFEHGSSFTEIVANSVYASKDASFDVGTSLRQTFFIGGTPLGSVANVDALREIELRELILKIKPLHTVAYLFVNYG